MTTPSEKDYLAANLGTDYWRTMTRLLTTERDNWRTKAEQRSYRIHELENKNTRLRVERDHLYSQGIGTALAEANARIAALEAENTKLRGDLDVALAAVERENAEANRLKAENTKRPAGLPGAQGMTDSFRRMWEAYDALRATHRPRWYHLRLRRRQLVDSQGIVPARWYVTLASGAWMAVTASYALRHPIRACRWLLHGETP